MKSNPVIFLKNIEMGDLIGEHVKLKLYIRYNDRSIK